MERLVINQYDKEYMKMAMLKHEETFREQVYELHRLYRIQKMLMKDIAKNVRMDRSSTTYNGPSERAGESVGKCELDDDLELTLGPRSFYEKKSGPSKGARSPALKWGPETTVSHQPWLYQALSLNMT
ncbi:hypothetical protein AAHA92_29654 [Salvia divinorum]|uniref:Uncharacterized protein n=1 Tax=Salvia divinorum TaxID=28513 RepID=A0ABD1G1Q1_SALDI